MIVQIGAVVNTKKDVAQSGAQLAGSDMHLRTLMHCLERLCQSFANSSTDARWLVVHQHRDDASGLAACERAACTAWCPNFSSSFSAEQLVYKPIEKLCSDCAGLPVNATYQRARI